MKLTYALREGHLSHVSKVERGLQCNCTCPCCGQRLIARKGSKVSHHFAHEGAECSHGFETVLHIMAKEILEQEKRLMLPPVYLFGKEHNEARLYSDAKLQTFDEVVLEKRYSDVIPDIIMRNRGRCLIIEIFVTHEVDEAKLRKIKKSDISAIEIDLSLINDVPSKTN